MRLKAQQINKITNYLFFVVSFFIQSYVDGKYIAYGDEPTSLKLLKYILLAVAIVWGMMQLLGKRHFVFIKELRNVLAAIFAFLAVSLVLILFRDGDLMMCLELVARYAMSILYAFVLLNVMDFEDIYRLMTYALLIAVFCFFLQHGRNLVDVSLYSLISFRDSYSPFESHYFAAPSINCCAFFLYYRKNKALSAISFLFVLMTFKRPQIVAAIVLLLLPLFVDPNRMVKKSTHLLMCVGAIAATVLWYYLLLPEMEWVVELLTGQSAQIFTSGRSGVLRELVDSGYRYGGLGSTSNLVGSGIEMDLVAFMLEMSLPVMAWFVFAFASVSGRRIYTVVVMIYRLLSAMTGSGLYNVTGVLLLYLFFGSVNYLQPDVLKKTERRKRWIRIKFR